MRALIFGSDGQDGYYLARFLLTQGYQVFGVVRKKTRYQQDTQLMSLENYHQIFADLTDFSSIISAIMEAQPDEIYNLAGQSEIPISWRQPSLTAEVNALGVVRILEAIRIVNQSIRFFQASSSEMFGNNRDIPLNESSALQPRNPYGTSKVFAHWTVGNYRTQYQLYACSGILFNHESPQRGPEFVTRKISKAVAEIKLGLRERLELGDIYAVRDWGHAADYVRAMWMMLQQPQPGDYVIASGVGHTVKEFAQIAFQTAGINLVWEGSGIGEVARDAATGNVVVKIDPKLHRNIADDRIVGNPTRAREELGFVPEYSFESLIEEIVLSDLKRLMEKCI